MQDHREFRTFLLATHARHPELFPAAFSKGFNFHSIVTCRKQDGFSMRRIRLKDDRREVFQIRPAWMMPYLVAETADVEKALYLRRWGVPFEALAYVFGRDAMFWQRAYLMIGRNSLVGTTIKSPKLLPRDLVADEKHSRHRGEKIFIATTASEDCILGCSPAENAGAEKLAEAYGEFKKEARNLDPDYAPETVNTDGWDMTRKAWKTLFPAVVTVLCFLHAFLKIKDRCRKSKDLMKKIGDRVWKVYRSETRACFSQRIRRLREWTGSLEEGPVKKAVLDLCGKASKFIVAYGHPSAHRTSNMVDRLMNYQHRLIYASQYFHGTLKTTRLSLRAMALIWNFHPYGTRTRNNKPDRVSPFHRVNQFCYHDNWLQNLLVASSMGGWM